MEEKKDATSTMDSEESKSPLMEPSTGSHRKTFSEASEVTINVTQETEATSPLTPDGARKSPLILTEVQYEQDDDDSSNDGSYFADPMILPSPKSGLPFAPSTATSNNTTLRPRRELSHRESDASLSLSDDSEEHRHRHGIRQHPGSDHRVDLYPQQLTRMHSISSLVSGSSNHSSDADDLVEDEVEKPSGRMSPVLGKHPPSRPGAMLMQSPASEHNTQPSPPTILSSNSQQQLRNEYVHPQPHLVTASSPLVSPSWPSQPPMLPPRIHFSFSSPSTSVGTPTVGSSGSRSLVYSEDSESMPRHSFTQVTHTGAAGGVPGQQQQPVPAGFNQGGGRQMGEQQKQQSASSNDRDSSEDANSGLLSDVDTERRVLTSASSDIDVLPSETSDSRDDEPLQVYWQRWLMLLYMSLLNLLSDWTCYSVAPIAVLTEEAFGRINSEQLVVLFLAANAIATACEPIILSRLGLRKTVLAGALLAMIGSIIKSGGLPPIIEPRLEKGSGEWRVYLGFFLVGLSQPLYQCTPALLSASWFPERERTLATGVALNSNQIGIGFAFIFGTLLVKTNDDIVRYFSLLSVLATLTFLGTLIQFDDAPPTPPSSSARVMRGTLDINFPTITDLFDSVRNLGVTMNFGMNQSESVAIDEVKPTVFVDNVAATEPKTVSIGLLTDDVHSSNPIESAGARNSLKSQAVVGQLPSPANWDDSVADQIGRVDSHPDSVVAQGLNGVESDGLALQELVYPPHMIEYGSALGENGQYYVTHPQYQPYWDAQSGQYVYYPVTVQHPTGAYSRLPHPVQEYPESPYSGYSHVRYYDSPEDVMPPESENDQGVEPVLTLTPHHLDIEIRDDQIWLSIIACMTRPGFIHSLVSFTVSGIVINTLSTFMDYLVRLNGAGREYTGIVGGTFQFVIMISSLVMGQFTDKTRAYYSVIVGMLVLGAFGLAECGVNLAADKGVQLRVSLVIVAALVGPLQPVSTELGVEAAYPLSENTVLVIQQLFANLLSACFIPCFKAFKNFNMSPLEDSDQAVHPQFTFSFYLLIVLHAVATVFFATFNGRYLRFEHELEKKEIERLRQEEKLFASAYGSIVNNGIPCDPLLHDILSEGDPLIT
ncbi:hypothetical protein MPSEU_000504300 [Mayamaea pseudoterrestris]|nr:hypothetical protein MPSEU_000504300 [Mayamaea pseudoterrestris]